jgi:hypothetical protein
MKTCTRVLPILQETPCEEKFADETPEQKAQHREIALTYRRRKRGGRPPIVGFRIRDLETFFSDRYGATMPDDDSGLDDFIVLAHHVAQLGDPRALRACAARLCPWMTDAQYDAIVAVTAQKPLCWTADSLAREIGLDDATRTRLGITTIGATDVGKAERANLRRQRNTEAKRLARAKAGAKPHASSAERQKPWLALGMSRRTYYRRQADARGSNSGTAAFLYMPQADQCHDSGPSPLKGDTLGRAAVAREKDQTSRVDRVRVEKISADERLNAIFNGGRNMLDDADVIDSFNGGLAPQSLADSFAMVTQGYPEYRIGDPDVAMAALGCALDAGCDPIRIAARLDELTDAARHGNYLPPLPDVLLAMIDVRENAYIDLTEKI